LKQRGKISERDLKETFKGKQPKIFERKSRKQTRERTKRNQRVYRKRIKA
jgi:hypothetical protein